MTISRELSTDVLVLPSTGKRDVLQAVRWSGQRKSATASPTSQTMALPAAVEIFEMLAEEDVFIKFGGASPVIADNVIASDGSRLFLAGLQTVPVPIDPSTGNPYLFMGVIQKSVAGIFQLEVSGNYVGGFSVPPAGTDPDFASVVLLYDFAGADGDTNITDLSNSAHVETFFNQAQVDSDITHLGVNTLLLDGVDDYIEVPVTADFDFGTGDFTIEFGFLTSRAATTQIAIGVYDTPDGWVIQHQAGTNLRILIGDTNQKSELWTPNVDQMYHVAITRSGTDLRMFIDGIQLGTPTTNSAAFNIGVDPLQIGTLLGGQQELQGNIGAVRLTKGVARYTADFTPPTEMYPTS